MIENETTEIATEANFDSDRYLANNKDVAEYVAVGGDARQHLLDYGLKEGRRQLTRTAFVVATRNRLRDIRSRSVSPRAGSVRATSARGAESPGSAITLFQPVLPRPKPTREQCAFYTCMDLAPDETIDAVNWDIRGGFDAYIGGYPIAGKTVLDVGTASGFLAYSAKKAGAKKVTAVDTLDATEFHRVPFNDTRYTDDWPMWVGETNGYLEMLKNSFWYAWHSYNSEIDVFYMPASMMKQWDKRFDVVIAGAIVEHMSDPVTFISSVAQLANEALIIAYTPVLPTEELMMKPMNTWDNPQLNYSWWDISAGLYKQILMNLGFICEFKTAVAICNEYDPPRVIERPTIVARRLA